MKFEDLYLKPADWCNVASRADVNPGALVAGTQLSIPIISSNMDTVYSPELAQEAAKAGAISCVHRFCTIEENVRLFKEGIFLSENIEKKPWVSIGTNMDEWERCKALVGAGAEVVVIDVANAACDSAASQFKRIKDNFSPNMFKLKVVVGNFCTEAQIRTFIEKTGYTPDAIKISVGSGSVCLTEKFTVGAGLPPVQTVLECKKAGIPMIFDGGFSSPRDFNVAMALGCSAVFMGRQFASTFESAGQKVLRNPSTGAVIKLEDVKAQALTNKVDVSTIKPTHSYYRGSAAADSYAAQGKTATFRPPEGKSEFVPIVGTVAEVVQAYTAAFRSAMTYCDSMTVDEFHLKVKWGIKNVL